MGNKKRVLALDIGLKRIGVAYSDIFGISITPTDYIQNDENAIEKIKSLVNQLNIGTIVVGLPLTLKGEEGEQARYTKEFAQKIKENINDIDIVFVDERFTTSLAEKQLKETTKKSKRKEKLDSLAAAYILQTYLLSKDLKNG
ncbi:Holliday junction resolvase RuvX [Venenivibrio stagnispumantis]|nr:Holliday junction resolvase RuvX [Venenivibrio stagnispumantis]MCW4573423.1 Holliday junction resolvase RuvX [Venenivibrio stagnispumantis]